MNKKVIRFPLKLKDDFPVRSIDELRQHFDSEKILAYFLDGRLLTWLYSHYYDHEATLIKNLDRHAPNLLTNIADIFHVDCNVLCNVDVSSFEDKNRRLAILRRYTSAPTILEKIEQVAFNQDDLNNLLLENRFNEIFLCNGSFVIPARIKNKSISGIGKVNAITDSFVDFAQNNLTITNILWDDNYQRGLAAEYQRNFNQSILSFKESADNGNSWAFIKLGDYFSGGLGTAQDFSQAFQWYAKAAEHGNYKAALIISNLYLLGQGVPQSRDEYVKWQYKAAELNPFIKFLIGVNLFIGNNPLYVKNTTDGFALIKEAAESGCLRAMYTLGVIYAGGYPNFNDFPINIDESKKWFQRAVALDDIYSICALYHLSSPYTDWLADAPADTATHLCSDENLRSYLHDRILTIANTHYFFNDLVISKIYRLGRVGFQKDFALAWEFFKNAITAGYNPSCVDIVTDVKPIATQSPALQADIIQVLSHCGFEPISLHRLLSVEV